MPRYQTPMSHDSRTNPYPTYPTTQPVRQYSAELATTNTINSDRISAAWTPDDDDRLMRLRTQGMNWGPIAANFPGKTANACRKRHERLMEKKNAESWDDGIKIEDLSRAYLDCREQIWKPLADLLGEKWQTVEAKCMEKGLKTLTTAGRAAKRNDLKHSTPPVSQRSGSEFDDSGLGHLTDHSPASLNNIPLNNMSGSYLSAYHHQASTMPQRTTSVSSNGSISIPPMPVNPVSVNPMPPNPMNMAQTQSISLQYYPPQTQQLFTTTQTASPSYMTTGFAPSDYVPYTQAANLPSLNRNYDPIPVTRNSPTSVPALPPATDILATSRPHYREAITTTY